VSSVTLRGVTKCYGSAVALDDVSLNIGQGLLVSLLGPSGCGKTTALRLVAGFVEPTAGEIAIGDRVVSSRNRMLPPERRNVSMVFQSYALWPHMTVAENVAYGLTLRKVDRNTIRKKVDAILATTKLSDLAVRYPGELSGGQQQRVAAARALVSRPQIVFADEPTGALDSHSSTELLGFLRHAVDDLDQTVVMVTHDPKAACYADRVLFLSDGHIVDEMRDPRDDDVFDYLKHLGD
jgi:iron(III) transport system ATP-binding protein